MILSSDGLYFCKFYLWTNLIVSIIKWYLILPFFFIIVNMKYAHYSGLLFTVWTNESGLWKFIRHFLDLWPLWPATRWPVPLHRNNKTDILCLLPHCTVRWLVCVCFMTHAEVSVPNLDGAILAACCNKFPIPAVGATCGSDLLALVGAGFKHRLVLFLWLQVPCAYSAVGRQENLIYL